MKRISFILIVLIAILGIFLTGCSETVVKFQCADGSFVDSAESCAQVSCQTNCPELDCSVCPAKIETKTVETTKTLYQCYDGTTQNSLSNCKDPSKYVEEIRKTTFNIDEARKEAIKLIEDDWSIEDITKFSLSGSTLEIEFSHSNWVEDIIKKSVFDFTRKKASYLSTRDKELSLQIIATSPMGGHLRCTTNWNDILKISKLEMGYENWKNSATCSKSGLY